ncbi:MAG TPA: outer membrane beta-barrel protein [Bryobacteraceae bacterium]|nr:outer membrane beta-barrel protein [Bryobacteraceae bacterium]
MRIPICLLAIVSLTTLMYAEGPDDQTQSTDTSSSSAAASTPAPTPPPKFGGFVFSGLIDGYINDNTNHPSGPPLGAYNQLQNFDIINGQPELSLIKFTVDKSDQIFGFHFDVGTGETMRLIHAGDPAAQDHKALRYFEQMYLIAKPKNMHGTEIDFGTFVTSAGAEVIESNGNWNYSRSLLFAWAIPYYHFGVKITTPVNKVWTVGAQIVNPWNETDGGHRFTNIGLTSAVVKGPYNWFVNYYVGPNNPVVAGLPSSGIRNLVDSTLLVNANDKLSFYVNGDYGRNNDPFGGHATWGGVAIAAKYQATKKFALSGRGEYFKDAEGFSTGTAQNLGEGTATAEYKLSDMFITRLEARHDVSSVRFFNKGTTPNSAYGQTTLTLGVMVVFGPYK